MAPIGLFVRMANAAISYVQYIIAMIAPRHLSIYYPYPHEISIRLCVAACTVLALISVAVFWRVRRFPWLFSGWLWYVGTLVPAIGIIQVGGQVRADRYTYIPLIGLFTIISWGSAYILKKWPFLKVSVVASSFAVVLVVSLLTRHQLHYWQNGLTLFAHTLKVTKENGLAQTNFGAALFNLQGNADSALAHFKESLRIQPNYFNKYDQGVVLGMTNRLDESVASLSGAIQFDSTHAEAFFSLGEAYRLKGNDTVAIRLLTKAAALKPDFWQAWHSLGLIMYGKDSLNEALSFFNKELACDSGSWQACRYLGLVYNKKRDFQRTFIYLTKAIDLCRDSSWEPSLDLGVVLFKRGKLNSAKVLFTRTIRLTPQSPEPYFNRAAIYFLQQHPDSAIMDYSRAIRLKPGWKKAHYNLAKTFEAKGMADSASVHFKKAL